MEQTITVVGLDVSKKTLVTGVLLPGMDRVSESKTIPNDPLAIEREVHRLAARGPMVFVYEAGPCRSRSTGRSPAWATGVPWWPPA